MASPNQMANMSRQLVGLVPSAALAIFLNNKLELALGCLRGVRCYFAAEHAPVGVKGRPLSSSSKAAAKKKKSDDVDLGGAESLIVYNLQKKDVAVLDFYAQFDTLLFLMLMPVFNLILGEATHYFGRPVDHLCVVLCLACVLGALWTLMRVDLLSAYTSGTDKVYAAFFGVVAFIVALASLALLPSWLLGFDLEAAAGAVGPLLTELVKARSPMGQDVPDVSLPPTALVMALAAVGGVISMVLFAPTLRFVRAFWLQNNIPDWATDYIRGGGPALTLRLTLHLLLPFAQALLWMKPVSDLLGVCAQELAAIQAVALLATGIVQATNIRGLVQRFADTTLTAWYQLKHGLVGPKREQRAGVGELIRAKSRVVFALIGKAAVQSMAPAALFLGLGVLQLYSALHPGHAQATLLLRSVVGFLAWWAGLSWFVFSAMELWLFRTGTLQN